MMGDTADVYREFLISNKNSIGLRPGSVVSTASTIPSPKGLAGNVEGLPYFNEGERKKRGKERNLFCHKMPKKEYDHLPFDVYKEINPRRVKFIH